VFFNAAFDAVGTSSSRAATAVVIFLFIGTFY